MQLESWQLAVLIVAMILMFWLLSRSIVKQTRRNIAEQLGELTEHLNSQDSELLELQRKVQAIELNLARNYVKRHDHVNDVASLRAQFSALALIVQHKLDEHTRLTLEMIREELKR